jgi:hypothetical protein
MRESRSAAGWFAFLVAVLLTSCGKTKPASSGGAGGVDGAGIIDGGALDNGGLASCLDQPSDLPRPPSGRLPCELIPPGFPTAAN